MPNSALVINVETGSNVQVRNNLRTYETISEDGFASFSLLPLGQYRIHATNGPKDYKGSVTIEEVKLYKVDIDYFTAMVSVYVEKNAEITVRSRGGVIYEGTGLGSGIPTEISVYYDDEYEVFATKDGCSSNIVTITPLNKQNTSIRLDFTKLSIKSDPGTNITVSKDSYSYSIEQSSGLDVVYLPESGNWTMSTENVTKTINTSTYKQYDIDASPYKVMTAIIDQNNSNPATCVTYADDAINMTRGDAEWDEFFGHYPCLFKDGKEIGRLNPNNFTQFEDGTPADITSGGDIMIAFPRRGLTLETINNKVYVKMTNDPNNLDFGYLGHTKGEEQKEIFYVAAFVGSIKDGKLRSLPNENPSGNTSLTNFRNYARANGAGYGLWTFYQWTFTQAMYVLKYANLNSQSRIGYGRCGKNGTQATGSTIDKGMDYGNGNVDTSMKLFGIEDFYGNVWNVLDGCIILRHTGQIGLATDNFNDTGNGYKIYTLDFFKLTNGNYISSVEGTTELGFIPKGDSGSASTYFSDGLFVDDPSANPRFEVLRVGCSYSGDFWSGVFCFHSNHTVAFTHPECGARCSWS